LTEAEAKVVLAAYAIPTVPTARAASADEAATAAERIGFPVVLKLHSETVTHKSDVGGVRLNLGDIASVRRAFDEIRKNVEHIPGAFAGVTVQPMVRDKGYELIVGSSADAQFGPVILFGSGGVLVEVYQDRALALPPLNRTLARRMMERTKIYRALQGVRGQKAVDLVQLETILVRFSQLLTDFPDIQEMDINPLLASPERLLALDARVLLAAPDAPKPQLAIHPYPNQLTSEWTLPDGTEITIRVIRPEDEPLAIALFETFSEQTVRLRYFSLLKRLTHESLIRLCHLDYDREMALVAVQKTDVGPRFLGVSRFYLDPETQSAEYAVVIGDPWQKEGLGRHLMQRLIDVAKDRGVKRLRGPVLRENRGMLALAAELGMTVSNTSDPSVVETALEL
jgi:acetyltransferase